MIDQKEGETELSVKIHYDNMVSDLLYTEIYVLHKKKHFRGE